MKREFHIDASAQNPIDGPYGFPELKQILIGQNGDSLAIWSDGQASDTSIRPDKISRSLLSVIRLDDIEGFEIEKVSLTGFCAIDHFCPQSEAGRDGDLEGVAVGGICGKCNACDLRLQQGHYQDGHQRIAPGPGYVSVIGEYLQGERGGPDMLNCVRKFRPFPNAQKCLEEPAVTSPGTVLDGS